MTAHYVLGPELEQILRPAESPARIARSVARLSDLFNGLVPWQAEYGREEELRHAYLGYYLPVNLPKTSVPLARWLLARPDAFAGRTLRVIDLGSGPGTMLLGLCDFVRRLPEERRPAALDLVAVDEHVENLRDAERLLRELATIDPRVPPVRFEALRSDLVADRRDLFPFALVKGRYDLAILGNVLCEIVRQKDGFESAVALGTAAAKELVVPEGAVVAIEPALRETARNLERWRDRLVAAGLCAVAPCVDQRSCPALFGERDWCVSTLPWKPPGWVTQVDDRAGLRKDELKLAYVVISPTTPPPAGPGVWQVVSDVLDLKGEIRVYLCGDGRWIILRHLKRRGRDVEAELRSLRRGDLVAVDGLVAERSLHALAPGAKIRRL